MPCSLVDSHQRFGGNVEGGVDLYRLPSVAFIYRAQGEVSWML
jgi:hypothetical protein